MLQLFYCCVIAESLLGHYHVVVGQGRTAHYQVKAGLGCCVSRYSRLPHWAHQCQSDHKALYDKMSYHIPWFSLLHKLLLCCANLLSVLLVDCWQFQYTVSPPGQANASCNSAAECEDMWILKIIVCHRITLSTAMYGATSLLIVELTVCLAHWRWPASAYC